ncbi:MAG: DUF4105 domain-containing protein [Chromatiales bacterium]
MKPLARFLVAVPVVLVVAWWSLALAFRLPGPAWLAQGTAVLFAVTMLAVLVFVRPFRRALGIAFLVMGAVLIWWSTIRPSNDRDWLPDVARAPTAEIDGDKLVVHNVRNFDYRSETDFTDLWEDRTYDLSKIRGVDMFISYWGSPYIAHPVVSWQFEDGQHLAMSIETRKERGEEYSAVRGFFREYELVYIAADERDIVRVRTNYRGEEVYLYHIRPRPGVARKLLVAYLENANRLAAHPEFYNAALDNCTTGIRLNVQHIGAAQPWDYRILVNGLGDQLLYERGNIDTSMPFEQLKAASLIVDKAKAADQAPDFSQRIREGLPQPPPLG